MCLSKKQPEKTALNVEREEKRETERERERERETE